MNKICAFTAIAAVGVATNLLAAAPTDEAAPPKADGEIVMITEATFPPYEFLRGKEIVGIDVAICQAVAKELGKTLKVEDAKFDAVIPSVIAGKADLAAAGITVTEDRKQNVDFSIPYVTSGIVIVSRVGQDYKTADSLKGKRLGIQAGTTSDEYCVRKLQAAEELINRHDSPAAAVAAMKAGKVDACIIDIDPAKNIVKGDDTIRISSEFLTKEEFAVAIRKGQPELLATLNKVITNLKSSGELDKIIAKFTAEADALKEAAEEDAE